MSLRPFEIRSVPKAHNSPPFSNSIVQGLATPIHQDRRSIRHPPMGKKGYILDARVHDVSGSIRENGKGVKCVGSTARSSFVSHPPPLPPLISLYVEERTYVVCGGHHPSTFHLKQPDKTPQLLDGPGLRHLVSHHRFSRRTWYPQCRRPHAKDKRR